MYYVLKNAVPKSVSPFSLQLCCLTACVFILSWRWVPAFLPLDVSAGHHKDHVRHVGHLLRGHLRVRGLDSGLGHECRSGWIRFLRRFLWRLIWWWLRNGWIRRKRRLRLWDARFSERPQAGQGFHDRHGHHHLHRSARHLHHDHLIPESGSGKEVLPGRHHCQRHLGFPHVNCHHSLSGDGLPNGPVVRIGSVQSSLCHVRRLPAASDVGSVREPVFVSLLRGGSSGGEHSVVNHSRFKSLCTISELTLSSSRQSLLFWTSWSSRPSSSSWFLPLKPVKGSIIMGRTTSCGATWKKLMIKTHHKM